MIDLNVIVSVAVIAAVDAVILVNSVTQKFVELTWYDLYLELTKAIEIQNTKECFRGRFQN